MADLPDHDGASFLAHAELARRRIEQTRLYFLRGRSLEALSEDRLSEIWIDAVLRWAEGDDGRCELVQDSAAEFALRGREPPMGRVRDAVGLIVARGMGALFGMAELERRIAEDRLARIHREERLRPN